MKNIFDLFCNNKKITEILSLLTEQKDSHESILHNQQIIGKMMSLLTDKINKLDNQVERLSATEKAVLSRLAILIAQVNSLQAAVNADLGSVDAEILKQIDDITETVEGIADDLDGAVAQAEAVFNVNADAPAADKVEPTDVAEPALSAEATDTSDTSAQV